MKQGSCIFHLYGTSASIRVLRVDAQSVEEFELIAGNGRSEEKQKSAKELQQRSL